ncbi:aminotransferase class I/II-fold pyridoxal phosphate-dependent enzyme [Pseudoxanthobacter sp.]|uniref:aminotransferase class I/II-fold pyridoxal phosphate-dependent enzyme n=1 Tax=Pseudoxanthobacter sp. TaxID=1925742 RepID=UPI002FE0C52F
MRRAAIDRDLAAFDPGRDIAAARRRFPDAPLPFIDLASGINPNPYPLSALTPAAFTHLPGPEAFARLAEVAAARYNAPSAAHVVCAPGSRILLSCVASLSAGARHAAVLQPPAAGQARISHREALIASGLSLSLEPSLGALAAADLALVVNPDDPDGRLIPRMRLLDLAADLGRRGGMLLVDEADMDVATLSETLARDVDRAPIAVLRTFGKFHGLSGLRLGFAISAPAFASRLRAMLGPWAVSGPALAVGTAALADAGWARQTRSDLAYAAVRLDSVLEEAGLRVEGGTALFRLARCGDALRWWVRLGQAGVLVRRFPDRPEMLRFGLPRDEPGFERLTAALALGPAD